MEQWSNVLKTYLMGSATACEWMMTFLTSPEGIVYLRYCSVMPLYSNGGINCSWDQASELSFYLGYNSMFSVTSRLSVAPPSTRHRFLTAQSRDVHV